MKFLQSICQFDRMKWRRANSLLLGIFLGSLLCLLPQKGFSQTTLSPGDIVITGVQSHPPTGNTDVFSLVTLKDLDSGTVIYFTDLGWDNTAGQFSTVSSTNGGGTYTNEGLMRLTLYTDIPAGTHFRSNDGFTTDWSWNSSASIPAGGKFQAIDFFNSSGGDQIYVFQSSTPNNPAYNTGSNLSFIYLYDGTNGFEDATNNATGNVPSGLSVSNKTAFTTTGTKLVVIDSTITAFSSLMLKTNWLTFFSNASNYVKNSSSRSMVLNSSHSVKLKVLATEPTANVANSSINFFGTGATSITATWSNPSTGGGTNRIVVLRLNSTTQKVPTDGVTYTTTSSFGSGTTTGSGNYVIYNGSGNSFNITSGISPNTSYAIDVYEYNGGQVGSGYYTNYRPTAGTKMRVTSSSNPLIYTSVNKIADFGSIVYGNPSPTTNYPSYTVSGQDLSNNLVVTPPTAFEISTTSDFSSNIFTSSSPLVLSPVNGVVASTMLYVRFNSNVADGVHNGSITHTSTGVSSKSITVSGTSIQTEPSTQSSITFGTVNSTSIVINFSGGNGAKRILIGRKNGSVNTDPIDGNTYIANTSFGLGNSLGTDNYVLYVGTGNTATITNVDPNSFYHFKVYEFNDGGVNGAANYLTTNPGSNFTYTLSPPNLITNFTVAQTGADRIRLTWTKPSGTQGTNWTGVVIFARESSANDATVIPSDALDYSTSNNSFTGTGVMNNNSKTIFNSSDDSNGDITVTGLTEGKTYYFQAYTYYLVGGNYENDVWSNSYTEISGLAKIGEVTNATHVDNDASIDVGWTYPLGGMGNFYDGIMIVGKQGGSITGTPVGDGTSYTASTTFGMGSTLNAGEFVVRKASSTGNSTITVTGLNNQLPYTFRIFVRKGNVWSTGVEVTGTPTGGAIFYSQGSSTIGSNKKLTAGKWSSDLAGTNLIASDLLLNDKISLVINSGHTVKLTQDNTDVASITVENGGKLWSNNSTSNSVVRFRVSGDITNEGTIGNPLGYDALGFEFTFGTHTLKGSSNSFSASVLNKASGNAGTATLIIDNDVTVTKAGTAIYNNSDNANIFNITINEGKTLQLVGNNGSISLDGMVDTTTVTTPSSYDKGGTIKVNGTLIASGRIYIGTNNTTTVGPNTKVSLEIAETGVVKMQFLEFGVSGTMGSSVAGSNLSNLGTMIFTGKSTVSGHVDSIFVGARHSYTYITNTGTVDFADINNSTQIIPNITYSTLKISNANGLVMTSNIIINKELKLDSGDLAIGSFILTLNGTVSGFNNLIGSNTSSLYISGSGTFNFPTFASGANYLSDLVINRSTATVPDSLILSSNLTVYDSTTISKGYLSIGNFNLTIGNSGSLNLNLTAVNGFIRTSGSGSLIHTVATGDNFLFAVGYGNDFLPMVVSSAATSATSAFKVSVSPKVHKFNGDLATDHAVNNTWHVLATNSTSDITLGAMWNTSRELTSFDRSNSYMMRKDGGNQWDSVASVNSASPTPLTNYYFSTSNPMGFNANTPYLIGINDNNSASPLPVTFIEFKGKRSNQVSSLSWSTASELNNSHFEVQRSTNGNQWTVVGIVEGHGTTQMISNYSFNDEVSYAGMLYYRLKQVDFNGEFEYSKIIRLDINTENVFSEDVNIQAYPNPGKDVKVFISNAVENHVAEIYNYQGFKIRSLQLQPNTVLTLDNLKPGMYIIRLDNGTTKSIVVQ